MMVSKAEVNLTAEYLEGLKRKDLQSLCKKYDIKCVGKNSELIEKIMVVANCSESEKAPEVFEGLQTQGTSADGVSECATLPQTLEDGGETKVMIDLKPVDIALAMITEANLVSGKVEEQAVEISTNVETDVTPPIASELQRLEMKSTEEQRPSPKMMKSNSQSRIPIPNRMLSALPALQKSAPSIVPPVSDVRRSNVPEKPTSKSVAAADISTRPKSSNVPSGKPPAPIPASVQLQTKKFDLKESLKRPLSYKPHPGPLKPFNL